MDDEDAQQFASDLEEHGIETESDFEDAYFGYYSSYYSEKEFAEDFYRDMIDNTNPLYNHIDWQSVWDCNLRYDFFEIDGHFFRNI